tara:strand:- start:96 stop:503 length:408 start_codon:yes stop_codon:yes gene_type:complete
MEIKTSKLGGKYNSEEINKLDTEHHKILQKLRRGKKCADCNSENPNWSSVNLGIFLCVNCAQIHRGIGTHITKVKGCTGTYLWFPDEIDNMKLIGNEKSNKIYLKNYNGTLPNENLTTETLKQHIINKYDKKIWC